MRRCARFFFGIALFLGALGSAKAALVTGRIYPINFTDIDGNHLSTAAGRITVVVLTTSADTAKARAVGDRIPDFCLANPRYRMITIVNLAGTYSALARPFAIWVMRQRLGAEARGLQKRYDAKKIARDARRDVFAVADFDGTVTSQLGAKAEASEFRAFVFGADGKLLRQWNDVASAADLDATLR
jgi:hypothetical protein